MKSINSKITIIIIIGLLFQVLITGSFYQLALTKKIIYEINTNANTRQSMLNDVIKNIEKTGNKVLDIQNYLLQYSQSKNIDFKIKDLNGNVVYVTTFTNNMSRKIEDRAFVEFNGKPTYVVYAYFPTKIESILGSVQTNSTKIILAFIVGGIAIIMSFIIYSIIGMPLKKLRKAMEHIDYGNTEVKIPYSANDEIGLLCRNIEEMGARLKKSEENQNHLIQAISHDLKTPLTSILGYVSRLHDGKVNSEEKRREYYEIIKRKAFDLKYLIDELEDFSKLFRDGKYDMARVDLGKFTNSILEEFSFELKQRGRELQCEKHIDEGTGIIIDEGKLRRVFSNIVGNALKYAGENAEISIKCNCENNFAAFEISDNGAGVPEVELEKIFNKFHRVETSRSREMGGTGLGLAICKDIIEGHGGEIWARNNPEGGLSILFTIPVIGNV